MLQVLGVFPCLKTYLVQFLAKKASERHIFLELAASLHKFAGKFSGVSEEVADTHVERRRVEGEDRRRS